MDDSYFKKILISKNSDCEILIKIINEIKSFFKRIRNIKYLNNDGQWCLFENDISNIVKNVSLSDTNNIDHFQYFISKRLFPSLSKQIDIKKINDINVLLIFLNAYLNLLQSLLNMITDSNYKIPNQVALKILNLYNCSNIQNLFEVLECKNFNFDKKSFFISSKIDSIQLGMLNEEKLNKHFRDFLSITSIDEKEEKMNFFSNKIADTLNDKRCKNCVNKYFNLSNIKLMCQGYFRHVVKDREINNNEIMQSYSKEWQSYNNNPIEKLKIMNNMFSVYLTILIMLKGDNLLNIFLDKI